MASRQGQVPEGWSKQGVMVPDEVWRAIQQLAARHGYGSMKTLATAAFGVLAGMPEHHRLTLLRWIAQAQIDGPETIRPDEMWKILLDAVARDSGNVRVLGRVETVQPPNATGKLVVADEQARKFAESIRHPPLPSEQTHQVTRILDPDILGEKAKGRKKGGAA